MKYTVHPKLVSFYAMALALSKEIIEGGPNAYTGTERGFRVPSIALLHISESAGVLGKIALRDIADDVATYTDMNRSLTQHAKMANARTYRDERFLVTSTFDSLYPGFEDGSMIDALEADSELFALKRDESDAEAEARMVRTAFTILPDRNEYNAAQFTLGVLLLVAAAVLAVRNGRTSPEDVTYPRREIRLQYGGPCMDTDELKKEVYGMAQAIVARIPLQQ